MPGNTPEAVLRFGRKLALSKFAVLTALIWSLCKVSRTAAALAIPAVLIPLDVLMYVKRAALWPRIDGFTDAFASKWNIGEAALLEYARKMPLVRLTRACAALVPAVLFAPFVYGGLDANSFISTFILAVAAIRPFDRLCAKYIFGFAVPVMKRSAACNLGRNDFRVTRLNDKLRDFRFPAPGTIEYTKRFGSPPHTR